MSDIGLTVSGMAKSPNRYRVTVTVARTVAIFPTRPSLLWQPTWPHRAGMLAS